jgi:fructose 1,6-bisphosphatase
MEKRLDRKALDEARQTAQPLADLMNHMGIPKP